MARSTRIPRRNNILRLGGVILALVLFLYSLSVDSPLSLAQSAPAMLGSAVIGMSAGVTANPDNTAAAQIAQKQAELDAREREVGARAGGAISGTRSLAAASLLTSLLVLVLVSANFYMDWRRERAFA